MKHQILVINPGGSSTKVALYTSKRKVWEENLPLRASVLKRWRTILDQLPLRKAAVERLLARRGVSVESLSAIAVRGGPLRPLASGTYRVTARVVRDVRAGRVQSMHASLLGVLLGSELARPERVPVFFTDPVSVDEFWPVARLSGLPCFERRALSHALNVRAVARKAAQRLKKPLAKCNFVVAHLGTGITVCALKAGRQVDSTNANEDGPFSPQRAGSLPTAPLVELCFSGRHSKEEVTGWLSRNGGLLAHLGTDRLTEVEKRIARRDRRARLVYDAMVYEIAKEIGSYSLVLKGRLDALIITGGMALSRRLVRKLHAWVEHLAHRIFVFPGENEMAALASGALRVLKGEEHVRVYGSAERFD